MSPRPGTISRHFVLAAGGTGGHLTPAFALAQVLERRGHHVALITDERGAEIPGKPSFLPAHVLAAGRFAGRLDVPFDFGRKRRLRVSEGAEQRCAGQTGEEALHGDLGPV